MTLNRSPWLCAVGCVVALPVSAQTAPQQLESVVVNADALQREDLLRPVTVLRGEALRERESSNLGATLSRELGVQNSAYGPGAGRPVIRGMDSARVAITESGLGVADVSALSPDHRVSADTFNSSQVEILRGPATLLYGSGASAGLVNVVSERIPQQRPDAFGATLNLRASSAEHERSGAVALEGPWAQSNAWRLEGFSQATRDYRLAAPLRDDSGNVIAERRLPNSDTDTRAVALGSAWFDAGTRLGVAVQRYESAYGIPNPQEPVSLELKRSRFEVAADRNAPWRNSTRMRSQFAFTDYAHTEFEPSGEAGARFTRKSGEGRVELTLAERAGFKTVLGTQFQHGELRDSGEGELPETQTDALALFAVGERRWAQWQLDLGARIGQDQHQVRENYTDGTRAQDRRFNLFAASSALAWLPNATTQWTLTLTQSQRAPAPEELYFVGAHPATFAFEVGDPGLRKEQSTHLELSAKKTLQAFRLQANVFVNRVRNYVFGAFDGSTTDVLDEDGNVEDTLATLRVQQADARIRGAEVELGWGETHLPGWSGRLWSDTVRGTLSSGPDAGDNLPRFAPTRIGVDSRWRGAQWRFSAALTHVLRQNRTSNFDLRDGVPETATEGYTTLDASVAYDLSTAPLPLTLYLSGRNLTNQDVRIHTSFLKTMAPPPGRSIFFGLRAAL